MGTSKRSAKWRAAVWQRVPKPASSFYQPNAYDFPSRAVMRSTTGACVVLYQFDHPARDVVRFQSSAGDPILPFRPDPRSRPSLASNSERKPSEALGNAKREKGHVRAPISGSASYAKLFPIRPGAVARAIHHNRLAAEHREVSEVRV